MAKIKIKNKDLQVLFAHVNYLMNAKVDSRIVKGFEKEVSETVGKISDILKDVDAERLQSSFGQVNNELRTLMQAIFTESAAKSIQYQLGRNFDFLKPIVVKMEEAAKHASEITDETERATALQELAEEEVEVEVFLIKSSKVEDVQIDYAYIKPLQDAGLIID